MGKWIVCADLLGKGPARVILRLTCFSGNVSPGSRGEKLGVSGFHGTPTAWTWAVPPWEGPPMFLPFAKRSQESGHTVFSLWQNWPWKQAPRLGALSQLPCYYPWGKCSRLVAPLLLMAQGILRPFCDFQDSSPPRHLGTLKPGTSCMIADL